MLHTVWQWARLTPSGPPLETDVPDAVTSAGSWTPVGAGTILEAVGDASDSTLARSSTGTSSDVMTLTFPSGMPGPGTIKFTIRHRRTP